MFEYLPMILNLKYMLWSVTQSITGYVSDIPEEDERERESLSLTHTHTHTPIPIASVWATFHATRWIRYVALSTHVGQNPLFHRRENTCSSKPRVATADWCKLGWMRNAHDHVTNPNIKRAVPLTPHLHFHFTYSSTRNSCFSKTIMFCAGEGRPKSPT